MELRTTDGTVSLEGATLVAGCLVERQPLPGSEAALAAVDPALLDLARFDGKAGQMAILPHETASALVLVGLGDELGFETVRTAMGNAVRAVKTQRAVTTLAMAPIDGATRAVAEGALLGGYEFRAYKSNGEASPLGSVEVVGADDDELRAAVIGSEATNLARSWVNTPAGDLSPAELASRLTAEAPARVKVEVWDRPRIEKEGLGGLLGVAAGSDRDPALVILTYRPRKAKVHLGLVGKGITFDSGGLSIKQAGYMEEMKSDMGGAAATAAATFAIARLELPVKLTTVLPIADNAIGGDATRPGDILKPVAGPTIEVLNTDAEGRLILADGLGLVRRHDPDLIVDVATLTGAARVALGDRIAAVFASDDETSQRMLKAASRAGEPFWPLPLFRDYRKGLDSDVADIKNVTGGRYGGAITAALFLAEYAGDGPWAHVDIAGPAMSRETSGEMVKGASGVGVRTLVELARILADSE